MNNKIKHFPQCTSFQNSDMHSFIKSSKVQMIKKNKIKNRHIQIRLKSFRVTETTNTVREESLDWKTATKDESDRG